jgi:hypothetical protein
MKRFESFKFDLTQFTSIYFIVLNLKYKLV